MNEWQQEVYITPYWRVFSVYNHQDVIMHLKPLQVASSSHIDAHLYVLFSFGATAPIGTLAYLHETLRFTWVY
jgi:hypothetical protein